MNQFIWFIPFIIVKLVIEFIHLIIQLLNFYFNIIIYANQSNFINFIIFLLI